MKVKICGMMRSKDVNVALDNGADAVGFVVGSPPARRNLTLSEARKMMRHVPIFATKFAVTTAQDRRSILKICSRLQPDALQLHHHSPELIRLVRRAYPEVRLILASAIRDRSSITRAKQTSSYSDAVLADSPNVTGMGGSGRAHDWTLTAALRSRIYPHPLILAGGLTPSNVRLAIRKVRPFAVDVSSGVEKVVGVKDHEKIKAFISNAKESVA